MRVAQLVTPRKPVKPTNARFFLAYSRCVSMFCPLMPAGPRKPVERHNGRVYWPTRDVAVGFVDFFHAPGRILGTQTFRAAGGCPHFTYTHFFGLPSPSQFTYTNFSGCRQRHPICILATQTFRVAGVLHFTYTNFSGGRGLHFTYTNVSDGRAFAFYLHTLSTTPRALLLRNPMKSIREVCYILKQFSRCARRSIKKSIRT